MMIKDEDDDVAENATSLFCKIVCISKEDELSIIQKLFSILFSLINVSKDEQKMGQKKFFTHSKRILCVVSLFQREVKFLHKTKKVNNKQRQLKYNAK